MPDLRKRISKALGSFRDRSDGSVTVEFVLWVPVFLGLMMLCADASLLFMHESNFWSISRDTARIVSRHGMDAEAGAAYARAHASFGAYTPEVLVRVDEATETVIVTITGQSDALAPFGMLNFALGDSVSVRVTQALEPI